MSNILDVIPAQLKAARQKKGLSQRALADRVGVPQAHVSRIEQGLVNPTATTLDQLAAALGLELRLMPRNLAARVKVELAADPDLQEAMGELCDGLEEAAQWHGETHIVSRMRRQLHDLLDMEKNLGEPQPLKVIGLLLRASAVVAAKEAEPTKAAAYLSQAATRLENLLQDLSRACADADTRHVPSA